MLDPIWFLDPRLRIEFDRCWPWLWASLCEFGPTHDKEQVWWRLYNGKAFLWSTGDGVIVGEFFNWPIGLRDFNYWLQGGNLARLRSLHGGIEEWARSRGAHRATGIGRDGWARAMDGDWRKGPSTRTKWLVTPRSFSENRRAT